MHEEIYPYLSSIEQQYNVKIVYACEVGSRAYGLASSKSDYDIRFIYVPHPEWYLSIDEQKDVIEKQIHPSLDLHGWEIRKALRLFRKSNPSLLEWLHSPVKYRKGEWFTGPLLDLLPEMMSPVSVLYHYMNMARRNAKKARAKGDAIALKEMLLILRPLLMCLWIKQYETFPALNYEDLLGKLNLPTNVHLSLERIRELKINGASKEAVPNQERLFRYIEDQLEEIEEYIAQLSYTRTASTEKLNTIFRETLYHKWGAFFD
ncbi:DNA polymerase beta superfamily protein [Pontibacillus salicampi]|uniref:DNA polymerase beta superfamily protein n=1 Tax=Pontibacillus salicampi TaxID=1449801 RepID=A0ABV6LM52_9BACI